MRTWRTLLAAAILAWTGESASWGQGPSSSTPFLPNASPQAPSRYRVSPQAGEWLVCVQTFKGSQARGLAEEMVEVLIRDYKLAAYVYDRAHKQRLEEQARIENLRSQHWDNIKKLEEQGAEAIDPTLRYRTMRFPDEYAVLVGKQNREFKDMDSAREFLDDLRKLKPPPNKFANQAIFGDPETGTKVRQVGAGYINPFQSAMVAHNPTIPLKSEQQDPEKADAFLKEMNANEPLSVLKCSKPWTLVVKVYQGQAMLQAPKKPSILSQLGLSKKEPELLNASAAQAHSTAEFLRKMNPGFEAYVMHHRSYSLVTVGQYEGPNDPNLLANMRSLAGLQIKDPARGVALETLNAQPLPMKIPR
jgi:hypothetical protein